MSKNKFNDPLNVIVNNLNDTDKTNDLDEFLIINDPADYVESTSQFEQRVGSSESEIAREFRWLNNFTAQTNYRYLPVEWRSSLENVRNLSSFHSSKPKLERSSKSEHNFVMMGPSRPQNPQIDSESEHNFVMMGPNDSTISIDNWRTRFSNGLRHLWRSISSCFCSNRTRPQHNVRYSNNHEGNAKIFFN